MSVVWKLFTKTSDEKGNSIATCNICKKKMKIPLSKTTTNLLIHLNENHKQEVQRVKKEQPATPPTTQKSQPSIITAFSPKMTSEARRIANTRLAMLIADKSLSFNLPSSRSFRHFVQSL
ncbi:unnamed protein product, partial [Cylicocyclus nassatus]